MLLSTDDNPRGCLPLWCSWRVAPLPCANRVNAFRVELYSDPPGAVRRCGSLPRRDAKLSRRLCGISCNPLVLRGPVSLPIVRPRLPFYGLRRGTPSAEAGDHPLGAAQDQHVGV